MKIKKIMNNTLDTQFTLWIFVNNGYLLGKMKCNSKKKEDNEKVFEQFHYFNIKSEIDSVYGNWAVSKDGDVVNYVYPYAILSIHLNDIDWVEKIKTKVWFKTKCEPFLKEAVQRAKEIVQKNS